jgi:hypothetical protein
MPLVGVQPMLLPTLRLTAEGHSIRETRKRLREQFQIKPAEAKQVHAKSGKNIFINRVAWAFAYLVMGELIELKDKNAYRITERGTSVLNRNPAELTISELHHNGWGAAMAKRKQKSESFADLDFFHELDKLLGVFAWFVQGVPANQWRIQAHYPQWHPLIPGHLANSVGGPEKAGVGSGAAQMWLCVPALSNGVFEG